MRIRGLVVRSSGFKSLASFLFVALLTVAGVTQAEAAPTLTIVPLTWGVIGLDSNNVTAGPNQFQVGARVCNTSATEAAQNVAGTFVFDSANALINLAPGELSTVTRTPLYPGACFDYYWLVEINRTTAAYNTARRFHIEVSAQNAPTVLSTPVPRELYVEKLVSQNRNSVLSYSGPTNVIVGQNVQFVVNSSTATNGYEQTESYINLSNVRFRIVGINRTYTAPSGHTETDMYADACGWDANPLSGTYRSCVGPANVPGGKAGGNITTTYTVRILSAGVTTLSETIYDFSGSSYHYNSDFGAKVHVMAATDPTANLLFKKRCNPNAVAPGGTLTCVLEYANNSASTTYTGVEIQETYDSRTTYLSASPAPDNAPSNNHWTIGTLAPGQFGSITLNLSVAAGLADGTLLTNTAYIRDAVNAANTSAGNPAGAFRLATEDTRVAVNTATTALLRVTKTPSPSPRVGLGSRVTYTINYTNVGLATAYSAVLSDTLGSGLTFVSSSPSPTTQVGQNITWNVGNVAPLASGSITVVASVSPSLSIGSFVLNSATLTGNTGAGTVNSTGLVATTQACVNVQPAVIDLGITLADTGSDPTTPGGSVTYTVGVTNSGPDTANNVIVTQVLDPFTTYVSSSVPCTQSPTGTLTCNLGTLYSGDSTSFTVTTTVALNAPTAGTVQNAPCTGSPGTDLCSTASVTATETDSNLSNNSAQQPTNVVPSADMAISKTGPASVTAGTNVVYTVTVTNNGPSAGQSVVVADPTPAGLTFVSNAGDCVTAYPCSLGTVGTGATKTITTTYSVPSGYSGANPIQNIASVSTASTDPVSSNNSSTASTPVTTSADMAVVKTGPASIVPGTNAVFTVVVTNNGTSSAANVSVVDPTPTGLTFVSNSGNCTTAYPCSLGTLASGATRTITTTYSVPSGYTTPNPVLNTATVSTTTTDPVSSNNSSTSSTPVVPSADVAVTKTGAATVTPGGNIVYTVTVTNNGPSSATAVSAADPTPSGLTFVSNTGSCTTAYPCSLGTLTNGATRTITTTYSVPSGYTTPNPLLNTATVSTTTADPVSSNNSATASSTVTPSADMAVVKTGPASIVPGTNAVFTIVVTNNGASNAAAVSVADPTPTGLTFVSNSGDCSTAYPCALGTVAAGATRTITTTYSVPSGYTTPNPVLNTATVSTTTTDPVSSNNSSTSSTPVSASADMAVVKTGPASIIPGTNAVFTVVVTNNGASNAAAVSVADPTPTGLTFVSNSGDCTTAYPCSLGTVAAGATRTITTTYSVPSGYTTPAPLLNTATVSTTTTDPVSGNNSSTSSTPVIPSADVQLTKTGPASVTPGGNIVYTVTITNNGPSSAAAVSVVDPTPTGLTFVSNSGNCTTAYPCSLGTLANGATRTITTTYSVPSSYTTPAPLLNTATVSSTTNDPTPGNNSATASTPVTPSADLSIVKTAPASVTPGTNAVYTIVVTNNGPSSAAAVSVTDPTPSGFTFVSNAGNCVSAYPCSLGTIPSGSTRTITSTFAVPAAYTTPNPALNSATVSSTTSDPVSGNNTSNASSPVLPSADLSVVKSAPGSVTPGTNLVYTVTVTNNGPSGASAVSVADPTPAGLTFVSNSGSCTTAYPCSLGTVASGATRTITSTYLVPLSYAGADPIVNTATVSTTTTDPVSGNNSSSTSTNLSALVADMGVSKTGPASVTPGTNVVYTVVVTNNGPDTATSTSVADPTPTGLTFVSNSGSCTTAYPCALGPLLNGATRTITTTYSVPANYAGANPILNTATVTAAEADPVSGNGSSTASTTVTPSADLQVVKTGPASVVPGTNAVFTIVVTNNGASDAAAVNVADPTPTGLTFVSNSGSCATAYPCALGTVAAGATRTITTTYSVPSGYTTPNPVLNTATVSSTTTDPTPGNNTSTSSTPVVPSADLAVVKTGPASIVPGTNAVFTITVTNNGSSDAVAASVADPTPTGLTFVSNSGNCTTAYPCSLGTVAAGATRTITTTYSVPSGYTTPNPVLNTATVSSTTTDPTPGNNTSTSSTPVVPSADLAVVKTGPASIVPGVNAVYTIVVTNNGSSDAVAASVADPTPTGLTFVSNSGNCATAYPCSLGTIAAGATRTITTTYSVPASYTTPDPVLNTATVSSTTTDPTPGNNTSTASTPVAGSADLAVVKTGPASIVPGVNAVYTIVVTNNGSSDAVAASVADPTPTGLTFVSNSGDCTTAYPCSLGTVAAGATRTITTTYSVPATYTTPNPVLNTATVSSTTTDPTPGNNTSTSTTPVVPSADMAVVKTGPASIVPGTSAVFTITVTNNGASDAAAVSVADPTPTGVTFVSNSGDCTTAYPCSLGTVAAGASRTITTTFSVPASYTTPAPLLNTATVSSTTTDPTPGNNTSTSTTPVVPSADLAVVKTGPASIVPGTNAVFTITVTNNGISDAAAVSVADPTPAGVTFVSNSGACTTAYPCSLGTVAAGATRTITTTFSVPASYTTPAPLLNTATVSSTTADPTPGNNTSTSTTPVAASADLAVVKTGPASIVPGANAVYTIVVTNNGASDAAAVTIADPTPTGLTFVSNSGNCATAYPCSLGTVPAGATRTITTTFSVPSSYTSPNPVLNTATVSSTTTDPVPGNNTSTSSTPVVPNADLDVVKTGPATIVAGTNAVYTIVVTNNGSSDAAAVSVADPTPTGLTFVSNSGDCSTAYPCSLGTLAAGASRTITTTFLVPAAYTTPSPAVNTATVSSTTPDSNAGNNTSSWSAPAVANADVAVSKTGPATVTPAGNLVFTVLVTNNGPSAATAVNLADPTPSGLTFVSNAGDCATAYPCSFGTLAVGATRTVTTTYSVPSSYTTPNPIVNTATVSTTATDPVPGNNTSMTNTLVNPNADLAITKTAPASVTPGANAVYTITIANNGPSDAESVFVSDPTPAGFVFVSNSGDCVSGYPCSFGTVAAGTSRTITSTFAVPASYTTPNPAVNSATVTTTTPDSNLANNTASASSPVVLSADLSIVKLGPGGVSPGTNLVYTILVTNNGSSDAASVSVADPTPTGLTFVSNSGACTTTFPCSLGTVAAGATRTITSTFSVPLAYTTPNPIVNTATVSSPTPDPVAGNNSSTASTNLSAFAADLAVVKTGPASVTPGNNVVYTITVTNNGPSSATATTVVDPTPTGLTFVSNSGDCATAFPCSLGTIAASGTKIITSTFAVPASYAGASPILNTAFVSSAVSDPNPGNDSSSASTTVTPTADVRIQKTGPATFTAGTNVVYTIAVTNDGPSGAADVTVTDPTPAGLLFVSNSGACGSSFPCSLGTVAVGTTQTITTTYSVPSNYSGANPVVNTATVSSSTSDPDSGNNSSTASTPAAGKVSGVVFNDLDGDGVQDAGENSIAGVTVTLTGPSCPGTGCVVTTATDGSYSFTGLTLGNYTVVETDPSGFVSTTPNTVAATVGVAGVIVNFGDLSSSSGGGGGGADLRIVKSHSGIFATCGEGIYTLRVNNLGPQSSSGLITVTDVLPTGLTYVSSSGTGWTCSAAGQTVTCQSTGVIASGAQATAITLTVAIAVEAYPTVNNTATVASGNDTNPVNDSSTHGTTVRVGSCNPDPDPEVCSVSLRKTHTGSTTPAGEVQYSLQWTNSCRNDLTDVTIADPLPAGLQLVTASSLFATISISGNTVTLHTNVFPAGSTATALITARIDPSATPGATITNTATITDPAGHSDTASDALRVRDSTTDCSVSLRKVHSGNNTPGGEIQYTLQWSNSCRDDLADTVITDPMPAGVLLVSASSSDAIASVSGNTATFTMPVFAGGSVGQGLITARIAPETATGATINNVATISDSAGHSATGINTFRVRGDSTVKGNLTCFVRAQVYARPGRYVKYEVRYKYGSENNALTLALPVDVDIISIYPPATTQVGNNLYWDSLARTSGKVTINTLVSASAEDNSILSSSGLVNDGLGNLATCEHVGVVDRAERLFTSLKAQSKTRPGLNIRYTARYREAVGSNQMTVSLPSEVTLVRAVPAPTGGTDNTLIWTNLPVPAGVVKIDTKVASNLPDGTVLVGSVTMTDDSTDLAGAETLTTVGSGSGSSGTPSGEFSMGLSVLRSVTAGTTTDITVRYENMQAAGTITLDLASEMTPLLGVPNAVFNGNSAQWSGLSDSSGSLKLRVAVGASANAGKTLTVRGTGVDGAGAAANAQGATVVRNNSTTSGGQDLSMTLTLPRTVTTGLTTDISTAYDGMQGTGAVTLRLPEGMTVQSTVPSGATLSGRDLTWPGLSDASGSLRVRVLVAGNLESGTELSVGGSVTDSSGATGSAAGSTSVR